MKPFFYLLAAIFISLCVYAFLEGVTVETTQQEIVEAEGPLKKAIDENSTVLCEIESFWSKYDIWGDTDTVYAPVESDDTVSPETEAPISCEEALENKQAEL